MREGQLVFQVGKDRMLILPIDITLLGKTEGGLEPTPRADILEAVQDLLILTVLINPQPPPHTVFQGLQGRSTMPI